MVSDRHEHRLDIDGSVVTLTFERPAAYNAVTQKLLSSLFVTLQEVGRDPALRAVVITGAGKSFCAGQALDDTDTLQTKQTNGQADLYNAVVNGFNPIIHALLTMESPSSRP